MKRQKYISRLLIFTWLLGLLTGCHSAVPDNTVPDPPPPASETTTPPLSEETPTGEITAAPLPARGAVDWNDIPDLWTGTGGSEASQWLDSRIYTTASCLQSEDTYENIQDGIYSLTLTTPKVSCLKNSALEAEINTWLQEATLQLQNTESPLEKYLTEEVLSCPTANLYTSIFPGHTFAGNLLSISVMRSDSLYAYDEEAQELLESRAATSTRYAVFDMRTGQQITLSDLFVNGTDLNALLNPMIASGLAATEGETDWSTFRSYGGLIRPFRGLPRDYRDFALSDEYLTLHFPPNNPYMEESYTLYLPLEQLAPYLAQPVTDCTAFVTDAVETFETFRATPCIQNTADDYSLLYLFGDETMGVRPYRLTDKLDRPVIERVNAQIGDIFTALHDMPLPEALQDARSVSDSFSYASSALMANRAYIQFQISAYVGRIGESPLHLTCARMFDAETGEAIPLGAVLADRENALLALAEQGLHIDDPDSHYGWYIYGPGGEIYICADNSLSPTYTLRSGFFDIAALK